MVTRKSFELGYTQYHEGEYWLEICEDPGGYRKGRTVIYHKCPKGSDCNILLVEEVFDKECGQCGPVEIPDDLWTLYVLLDGRGVYKNVE
jgi:hypothetical protein